MIPQRKEKNQHIVGLKLVTPKEVIFEFETPVLNRNFDLTFFQNMFHLLQTVSDIL
jgi:hypothetical protein